MARCCSSGGASRELLKQLLILRLELGNAPSHRNLDLCNSLGHGAAEAAVLVFERARRHLLSAELAMQHCLFDGSTRWLGFARLHAALVALHCGLLVFCNHCFNKCKHNVRG